MEFANIYKLFEARVSEYSLREDGRCAVFYVRRDNTWAPITWEQFGREAHEFACALTAQGLSSGASVCVLMGNVPEWPICDLGVIIASGVSVGLYPTSSAEQCQYIINHSDAEFVVVDTRAQFEKILAIRRQLPKLKAIISLENSAANPSEKIFGYRQFLQMGRAAQSQIMPKILATAAMAKPDERAMMVYTSGTTGLPKGACLSHRYILNSVESLRQTIPIYDTDVAFSYLPYCHVAERISGLYNRLYAGAAAYFVDDLQKLGVYMIEVKPTVFPSLPRFFEKIHARALADLEKETLSVQQEFFQALELGRELVRLQQTRESVPEKLQRRYDEYALHLLQRLKKYFGGRVRLLTSGGAPLPHEIAEFFAAAGLPILQAYGLTENICVAFNRADHYKFGTVGPAMPGCQIRIEEDGEILVKSEMMFSGYYKAPEQTAEMFRDGWLATGDLGEMDDEGFLKITGRKKELLITSTGKNIAPALLENLLKEHHLISQAMIFGEGKSYLTALLTLNQIEAEEYAKTKNLSAENFSELMRHPEIQKLVREIVDRVNARVSATEAIRKFIVLDHDFSIEADELTPTLKLRRNVVNKHYGDLMENLYE